MSLSIKELAELAGVSTATVSRAFNNSGYVNPETKEKIIAIAASNGFVPRKYKHRTKSSAYGKVIGVVVPDINNSFYSEVVMGVESITDARGIQVIISNSNETPGKETQILDTFSSLNVDGIIIAPVSSTDSYNVDYLQELNRSGPPIVLLDRDLRSCYLDGVFMDNYGGTYEAIRTLIMNGHKDIAFISGPMTSTNSHDRFNAYVAALKDFNIPVQESNILYGNFKFDSGYNLTKKIISSPRRPTAIFACSRRMASGSLLALSENNIQVGKDISFISCGRLDGYDGISYIDYPTNEIGRQCASMLIEKATHRKKSSSSSRKRITFDMQLVLLGSEKYPSSLSSDM